jgi:hypothetical protein
MSVVPQAQPAATTDAAEHAGPLAESHRARTPVLITEQEVVFGGAAAVPLPRITVRHRLAEALKRIPLASLSDLRPRRRRHPSRHDYLERSFMAREMLRL